MRELIQLVIPAAVGGRTLMHMFISCAKTGCGTFQVTLGKCMIWVLVCDWLVCATCTTKLKGENEHGAMHSIGANLWLWALKCPEDDGQLVSR